MLTKDPNPYNGDEQQLSNIYERNKTRIREIDATLHELTPLIDRLTKEREACIEITRRTRKMTTGQCNGESVESRQDGVCSPGSIIGAFIIDPIMRET